MFFYKPPNYILEILVHLYVEIHEKILSKIKQIKKSTTKKFPNYMKSSIKGGAGDISTSLSQ